MSSSTVDKTKAYTLDQRLSQIRTLSRSIHSTFGLTFDIKFFNRSPPYNIVAHYSSNSPLSTAIDDVDDDKENFFQDSKDTRLLLQQGTQLPHHDPRLSLLPPPPSQFYTPSNSIIKSLQAQLEAIEKEDEEDETFEAAKSTYKNINVNPSDQHQVSNYLYQCFDEFQQIPCKLLAKAWIKTLEPRKQSQYPYKRGDFTKPPWWPANCRHKEPDHLKKDERINLLIKIVCEFKHRANELVVVGGLVGETETVNGVTKKVGHLSTRKMNILDDMFRVLNSTTGIDIVVIKPGKKYSSKVYTKRLVEKRKLDYQQSSNYSNKKSPAPITPPQSEPSHSINSHQNDPSDLFNLAERFNFKTPEHLSSSSKNNLPSTSLQIPTPYNTNILSVTPFRFQYDTSSSVLQQQHTSNKQLKNSPLSKHNGGGGGNGKIEPLMYSLSSTPITDLNTLAARKSNNLALLDANNQNRSNLNSLNNLSNTSMSNTSNNSLTPGSAMLLQLLTGQQDTATSSNVNSNNNSNPRSSSSMFNMYANQNHHHNDDDDDDDVGSDGTISEHISPAKQ